MLNVFPALLKDSPMASGTPTGLPLVPAVSTRTSQSLNRGGIVNPLSGLGGPADKSDTSYFVENVIRTREALQVAYVQSWAAMKFINIPVDDMFIRGRRWEDDDEAVVEAMEEIERTLEINSRIADAMKAGRLYGTGLLVIVSKEAPLHTPLIPEFIREGDLTNLLVFDRFDARIDEEVSDIYDRAYGQPEMYIIKPRIRPEKELEVHASRIIRFDGRRAVTTEGWSGIYDRQWGISELIYAMIEILHDASLVGGIAHLSQEADIGVVKMQNFRDSLMSNIASDEPSAMEIGSAINRYKSIFRTLFIDANDDFSRETVAFGGLADLMDRFAIRLAAMADIPATRFLSRSPVGMNSTGESDMKNYAIHVAAMQQRMLAPKMRLIDEVVSRSVGLSEIPQYEWLPLTDMSEEEQADISRTRTESLAMMLDRFVLTEDEVREILSGDPLYGELGPLPEDAPKRVDPAEEMALQNQNAGGQNDNSGASSASG